MCLIDSEDRATKRGKTYRKQNIALQYGYNCHILALNCNHILASQRKLFPKK